MAGRSGRGPLRTPSSACRIGSVDRRTQGRVEHTFLDAGTPRLYRLCEDWPDLPLPLRIALICHRSHGKTDAGITAICVAAIRLLALGTFCGTEHSFSGD